MAAEARKLLEELMGGGPQEEMPFTDKRVCRSYLCGLCPHTLFTNTKMDLGPCPKLHSDKLKNEYEKARHSRSYGYEEEFEQALQQFVSECDHRINNARRRLEKQSSDSNAGPLMKELADLGNEVATLTEQVEALGEEGKVDEAMRLHDKVEELNKIKAEKEEELKKRHNQHPSAQEQKLRACDVCGAFLSILDSDARLADHFGGKLHLGYVAVRDRLRELQGLRGGGALRRPSNGSVVSEGDQRRRREPPPRYEDRRGSGDGGGRGRGRGGGGNYSRSDYRSQRPRSPDRSRYHERSRSRSPGSHRDSRYRDRRY